MLIGKFARGRPGAAGGIIAFLLVVCSWPVCRSACAADQIVGSPFPASHDEKRCGVNGLYMLMKMYAVDVDYNRVASSLPVTEKGSSLADMSRVAAELGFPAEVTLATPSSLHDHLPAIAHVRGSGPTGHYYLICNDRNPYNLNVIDGTSGMYQRIDKGLFYRSWTGYLLVPAVTPVDRFERRLCAVLFVACCILAAIVLPRAFRLKLVAASVLGAILLGAVLWADVRFVLADGEASHASPGLVHDAVHASPVDVSWRDVPLALKPTVDPVDTVTDRQVIDAFRLALPDRLDKGKIHGLVHALRLWGLDARFDSPNLPDGSRMLEIVTDSTQYSRFCPDKDPLLYASPLGVSYRVDHDTDGLPHVDKALSVFAELTLRSDIPLRVGGETHKLADALDDAALRFVPEQELEWTTIALVHYLPPGRTWRNKFGVQYSFDDLATLLVERPYWRGPCMGTHILSALAHLVGVDAEVPILSPPARALALGRLREASKRLESIQSPAGGWPPLWYVVEDGKGLQGEYSNRVEEIRVAGHHLEWIAIAPAEVRPSRKCVERALGFLCRRMLECTEKEHEELAKKAHTFPPLSHAVRALSLYHPVPMQRILGEIGRGELTHAK
jgi:hypothetical protein